jgi:hypothetical protein
MVVAAARQRRYINGTSARLRQDVLDRVQQLIRQQRPPVAVPSYVLHDRRCNNPQCRATLRAGAKFCQRCGRNVDVLSEVA